MSTLSLEASQRPLRPEEGGLGKQNRRGRCSGSCGLPRPEVSGSVPCLKNQRLTRGQAVPDKH